jgi:PAS domain S-box-containing protein
MLIQRFNIKLSEKVIIQLLIFFGSIACLVFGIGEFAFNRHISEANILQFLVGVTIFFLTFLTQSKNLLYRLGHIFIIEFNIINVLIIYLSQYESKYSYQYIVFFLVSSWFFEQKSSFWINIILNILCVGIILFIGGDFRQKEEFLLTFFVATVALVLLMMRKIKNETLLKESETRYRLIAENSADLICTHSQGGNFEFVSPSVLNITGHRPEELMYQSPTKWLHPDDVKFFAENFFSVYKPNEFNKTFDFRFRKKDNSYLWLESVVKIF